MNFDPDALRSRELRAAFDYWQDKRGSRPMPSRTDIDPSEMVPWLSQTLLVDVVYADGEDRPLDFRFRLVGTDVVERYGHEFTGRHLSSLDLDGKAAEIMNEYGLAVSRAKPQYFVDEFVQFSGRPMHYERLLMPLSDDGTNVNMLLGVQKSLFADA
jgi:hypothetical protein